MASLPASVKQKMVESMWPELAAYEKGPQTKVADTKEHILKGATAAKTAGPGDVAGAVVGGASDASRILDIAPGGAPAAGAVTGDNDVVVDETGTLGDPSETGEGTSDDLTADPSTATGDPGTDADPNADLTGAAEDEESATKPPAKGSAQERIVELNDKLEGAMVFGKAMQEQFKQALAENARLTAERSPGTSAAAAAPQVVASEDPGPIPDMSDSDIAFDNDKYRAKMQEWSRKMARHEARQIAREMTGAAQAQTLLEKVETKVKTFIEEHPEFDEVVTNNAVLKANQLAPDAGLAVARSAYTPELLMKFGKDPVFAIRVAKMHPADQLLVVGEMIADIKAEKKVAGKTTTTTTLTNKSKTANSGGAQPAARKSLSQAPPAPAVTRGGGVSKHFDPLDPNVDMRDFVNDHRKGKQSAREQNRKQRGLS